MASVRIGPRIDRVREKGEKGGIYGSWRECAKLNVINERGGSAPCINGKSMAKNITQ